MPAGAFLSCQGGEMCFHCGSEMPALAGHNAPGWGRAQRCPVPTAAPSVSQLQALPSPRFWRSPSQRQLHLGIPSPRQTILGPISSVLCLGSINILPRLAGWLSSRLMLGQCQASLWEDEDGLVAGWGRQPRRSFRMCLSPSGPHRAKQGCLGA